MTATMTPARSVCPKSLRPALLVAAAVSMSAASAFAQDSMRITPGLSAGDTFDYRFSTDLMITQTATQGEADAVMLPDQELEYEADVRFTVGGVGEDGLREVRAVVLAYEAEWESGPNLAAADDDEAEDEDGDEEDDENEVEFDYDLEPLRGNLDEVFPDPAMMSDADRAMVALARTTIVMQVDASGEVVGVRGLAGFNEVVTSAAGLDDRLLGFFTDAQFLELTSPVFTVDGAAGAVRSEGDTWEVSKSIDFSNIAAIDYAYSFELASIDDDEAVIEGSAVVSMRTPTTPNPIRPGVTLGASNETVRTVFDRDQGRVTDRVAQHTITMTFRAEAGGESVVIEQTTRGEREAELIEEDED
jgi:hypothetical protein